MPHRYCDRHGVVDSNHNCERWPNGTQGSWRRQRAQVLALQPRCTHPGCDAPSVEVHHVDDHHVRAVCHQHNPRGSR